MRGSEKCMRLGCREPFLFNRERIPGFFVLSECCSDGIMIFEEWESVRSEDFYGRKI